MIHVILLEPVIPGNIGAIARAMKNFEFSKLVLINPHCDHLCAEARNRAKHSQEVLENAEVSEFFVVDDYDYLVATTARLGTDYNISRSPLLPSELAEKIKGIDPGRKIGLVIGREGPGMFNEEIAKCDFIVTIPSMKGYSTLNISHAVAIILYELYKSMGEKKVTSHITPIGNSEKNQIIRMFDDIFNRMSWETDEKKDTQQKLWRRVLGKAMLTKREAYGVMGFLRKVLYLQQGKARPQKPARDLDKHKKHPKKSMPNRPLADKQPKTSRVPDAKKHHANAQKNRANKGKKKIHSPLEIKAIQSKEKKVMPVRRAGAGPDSIDDLVPKRAEEKLPARKKTKAVKAYKAMEPPKKK